MKFSIHFSTTTKKPSIDHSVADPDMGSQNLGVPSFPIMGSQQRISSGSSGGRNKVSEGAVPHQVEWGGANISTPPEPWEELLHTCIPKTPAQTE